LGLSDPEYERKTGTDWTKRGQTPCPKDVGAQEGPTLYVFWNANSYTMTSLLFS